jgi:glycerophosphoryl diester phosphodiesterase
MWAPLTTGRTTADGSSDAIATRWDDEPVIWNRPFGGTDRSIPFWRRGLLHSGIGGLSTLLAGCLGGPESTTDGASDGHEVRLIGHRGCADQYPENTIRAVEQSAPHVDMIEFDVQRCGSGELVVFHDDTLDRLTSASGQVSTTEWERLRELTILDSTETIPRFDDFLEAVPADTGVNIELKHTGMAEEIVPAAEECNNEVLVSSFRPDAIQEIRDRSETIDIAFLINDNPDSGRSFADDVGCVAINPSVDVALESDIVERAREDGLEVNVWVVDDSETAGRLVDVGADGLFVDRWDLLDR